MKLNPRRVEKPWGYELIWAETDLYVGKILHINAGEALSVQMHHEKDETMHLLEGEVHLMVGESPETMIAVPLAPGESFRIVPGTVHRVEAVADSDILEASTPHLDDLVRFSDRYGRTDAAGDDPESAAGEGGASSGSSGGEQQAVDEGGDGGG